MTRRITTVDDALAFAELAHADQRDQAGRPYIEHVQRVAAAVGSHGVDAQIVAALHDVVERLVGPFVQNALRKLLTEPG